MNLPLEKADSHSENIDYVRVAVLQSFTIAKGNRMVGVSHLGDTEDTRAARIVIAQMFVGGVRLGVRRRARVQQVVREERLSCLCRKMC